MFGEFKFLLFLGSIEIDFKTPKMIRILICDDHELFADGVCARLRQSGFDCDFVTTPQAFENKIEQNTYNIILCDINISGTSGFDLIKAFRPKLKNARVFILSGYNESYLFDKARNMKLDGFFTKSVPIEQLIEALKNKDLIDFIEPDIQKKWIPIPENIKEIEPRSFYLSGQEKKIIQLVAQGLSSKEIGEKLFISKNTVDTHRRNINRKLELNSVGALITFAHENGLIH